MSNGLSEVRKMAIELASSADFRSKVDYTLMPKRAFPQMQDIFCLTGRRGNVARLQRAISQKTVTGVSFTTTSRVTHHFKFG